MKRRLGAVITTIIILIAVATLAVTVQWSTTARIYQVVIELVRADGTVNRLWSQSTARRGVSAREFEATLGTTHPR